MAFEPHKHAKEDKKPIAEYGISCPGSETDAHLAASYGASGAAALSRTMLADRSLSLMQMLFITAASRR
jgi:hypothetical protein